MSNLPQHIVTDAAYLTLHYRLASMDGQDIVSTFGVEATAKPCSFMQMWAFSEQLVE